MKCDVTHHQQIQSISRPFKCIRNSKMRPARNDYIPPFQNMNIPKLNLVTNPRVQFLLSMFNIEHDTCSTLEVGQGKCSKYEHASCSTMLDMTHVQQLFKLNMHLVQLD